MHTPAHRVSRVGRAWRARARRLAVENARLRRWQGIFDSEQRALIGDPLPVGVIVVDAAGVILGVNRVAGRLLGVPPRSIVGKSLLLRVSPADCATFALCLQQAISNGEGTRCQVHFERAGLPVLVARLEAGRSTDPLGRPLCWITMIDAAVDKETLRAALALSERSLRAELTAAHQRFTRIAAVASELAEPLALEQTIARAAQVPVPELASFCAVDLVDDHGYVLRAATAGDDRIPASALDPYAPRGSATVVRTGEAGLLLRPSIGDFLALATYPEGLAALWDRVASYMCLPLRAHGRVLGAMTFVRSKGCYTSEDVALAEEIARHAAVVIDNARLYHAAQESDRRKDEFLAMLAHELRNPLAAIVLAAGLMRPNGEGAAPRAAGVIARQSTRLVRLVDDLLDVSRVTRGKITLQRERVALGDVIAKSVESVRPLIDKGRHTLEITQPPEPIELEADPARLEQVLVNLLANAARYTAPSGRITVDVTRASGSALVRVRDTGMGMSREMLARVFEPFTRGVAAASGEDSGLGIGLTLARAIVDLHGGRIDAYSDGPGRGSEIVVRLPVARTPAPAAPERTSAPHTLPRRRLLLVEDEPDVAEMMRERLRALGQEVHVARDGSEAIEEAIRLSPELLLIDVGLPGMNGYDVARRLRREAALAHSKFIALTGYGDETARRRSAEAGFDNHFTKPIADDALRALLDGV